MDRHIIIVLCVELCLACWVVGQDKIEGWKIQSGNWQREGDVISCKEYGVLTSDVCARDIKVTGKIMAVARASSGRGAGHYSSVIAIHNDDDPTSIPLRTYFCIAEDYFAVYKRSDAKSPVKTLCRGDAGVKPPSGWVPFVFVYQGGKISASVGRARAAGKDDGLLLSGDRLHLSVRGATKFKDLEVMPLDKESVKVKKPKPGSLKISEPMSKAKRFFYLQKDGCVFAAESMGLANRDLVKWFNDTLCLGDDLCYYLTAAVDEGRKDNYTWQDDEPAVRVTVVKDKRKNTTESFGNICMYGEKEQGRLFEVVKDLQEKIEELEDKADDSGGKGKKNLKRQIATLKKRLALLDQAKPLFEGFTLPSRGKTWVVIAFAAHFDTREITSVEFREGAEYAPMTEARDYIHLRKDLGVDFPKVW